MQIVIHRWHFIGLLLSTVIIRLSPGKLDLEERGLIREGEGLFKRQENMLQKGLRNVLKY